MGKLTNHFDPSKSDKVLYLVRGLPGSGKSTLAKKLSAEKGLHHVETDMWFMRDGQYCFNKEELGRAHMWCQDSVRFDMQASCGVVCSNTFTTVREMLPYFQMAKKFNYRVVVVACDGKWQNEHNVPQEALDRMASRWVTNETLFQTLPLDLIDGMNMEYQNAAYAP